MIAVAERTVPLDALSARQQRLVERHLPLVRLTLDRMGVQTHPYRSGREKCELVQEGCLALADAVQRHDPTQHGGFAPFAMARVRHAVSVYLHERCGLIRVPFISQRRLRKRAMQHRDLEERQRHRPGPSSSTVCPRPSPIPRIVPRGDLSSSAIRASRRYAVHLADRPSPAVTIGELIRDRYDAALARAMTEMKHSPSGACADDLLLERCRLERWTIPEPEMKTPLRRLAREMGSSLGRVTRCEAASAAGSPESFAATRSFANSAAWPAPPPKALITGFPPRTSPGSRPVTVVWPNRPGELWRFTIGRSFTPGAPVWVTPPAESSGTWLDATFNREMP